jgi:hypothetical protein
MKAVKKIPPLLDIIEGRPSRMEPHNLMTKLSPLEKTGYIHYYITMYN